jgi:hypothetical protein
LASTTTVWLLSSTNTSTGKPSHLVNLKNPVSFDDFKQRVRRHRSSEVLKAVSTLAANYAAASVKHAAPPSLPNYVQPFSLAAVARAAILYGNEHRNSGVSRSDLIQMCALYANVYDPALKQDPSDDRLRGLLHRTAYEQFNDQFSAMENIARTLLLFEDHAYASPNAPQPTNWQGLLGCDLLTFMRVGFSMHLAGLQYGGDLAFDTLRLPNVTEAFAPLSADQAKAVIDRCFSETIANMKVSGTKAEVSGFEKWSLNPLQARPIIRLPDRYLMPSPRWVIDRFTPTGLYFIGLEKWGSSFTDALGLMFEAYIGTQLRTLKYAEVHPEIVYGNGGKKTVDYFVVTDEAVILVEAKSARPIAATRLGESEGDEDIEKKIGKAIKQINNSARLLQEKDQSLSYINPKGLPVYGVVVTLEPFHLVNAFSPDLIAGADFPTVIVSSHELEGFISAIFDRTDVGSRFMASFNQPVGSPHSLQASVVDLPSRPNQLLKSAWERFSPTEATNF